MRRNKVEEAYSEYVRRQSRESHPEGEFDDKARWYPSDAEYQACCDDIRAPSAHWPNSLNKHCRSIAHISNLFRLTPVQRTRLRKRISQAKVGEADTGMSLFESSLLNREAVKNE